MTIIYEDNHIIVVNKSASEIVQGDKTGDVPLSEKVKAYLRSGARELRGEENYPNDRVGYGALCVERSLPE